MIRTEFFAKIENNNIVGQFTEYQAEIVFGSRDQDVYENSDFKIVRIYEDLIPPMIEGSSVPDPSMEYKYSLSYTPGDNKAYNLYTTSPLSDEQLLLLEDRVPMLWTGIRRIRNELLEISDKESGAIYLDVWNNLDSAKKAAWEAYRQALRDVPQDNPKPYGFVWPIKPS